MPHATSADGTVIGYDRLSDDGPAVVLVSGGLDDGTENLPLPWSWAAFLELPADHRRARWPSPGPRTTGADRGGGLCGPLAVTRPGAQPASYREPVKGASLSASAGG